MVVTNIVEVLDAFYFNPESKKRSIVIDGKWGAGKTYSVRRFLNTPRKPKKEEREDTVEGVKPNSIYISLFGINSPSEIVLKLAKTLDARLITNVNGNFSIVNPSFEKQFNKHIVVFDDLERKGKGLEFDSIFGIIDGLRNLGFKIVCVANSNEIKDRDERGAFLKFKEKSFDSIVYVSADPSVVRSLFPKLDPGMDVSLLKDADDNLRLLAKTKNEYSEIISFMEKKDKKDFLSKMNLSESLFIRCVLLSIKCVFSNNTKKPDFEKDDLFDYKVFAYEKDVDKYGNSIANELNGFFSSKNKENAALEKPVRILVECLTKSDYQGIIDEYYCDPEKGTLSERPLFYLSDDEKLNYKNALFKNLSTIDFGDKKQGTFLAQNIGTLVKELSRVESDSLASRIVETVSSDSVYDFIQRMLLLNQDKPKGFASFIDTLETKYKKTEETRNKEAIYKAFNEKDYGQLTDFLYERKFKDASEKKVIAGIFAANDFFLPDLSESIDETIWTYCHEIARFIADMEEYRQSFIAVLKKQCEGSSSASLRDKCGALVKYNFPEKIDFYEQLPLKKPRGRKASK